MVTPLCFMHFLSIFGGDMEPFSQANNLHQLRLLGTTLQGVGGEELDGVLTKRCDC